MPEEGLGTASKPFLFEDHQSPLWHEKCPRALPLKHRHALESGIPVFTNSQLTGMLNCGYHRPRMLRALEQLRRMRGGAQSHFAYTAERINRNRFVDRTLRDAGIEPVPLSHFAVWVAKRKPMVE